MLGRWRDESGERKSLLCGDAGWSVEVGAVQMAPKPNFKWGPTELARSKPLLGWQQNHRLLISCKLDLDQIQGAKSFVSVH